MLEEDLADDLSEDENIQLNKYLLFPLGNELYGIPIDTVINIVELQKITAVPDVPNYIKGLINLRGNVLPVIDLRLRFHMPPRDYDDRTCIIIAKAKEQTFGMIVDTVAEVQDIPPENIEPPVQVMSKQLNTNYLQGIGKVGDSIRLLLNVEKLLDEDDLPQNIKNS
jgi:purine-binding chemotaxis protein CheW